MENIGILLYRHLILNQKKIGLYLLATGLTFFALFFIQSWIKNMVDFRAMLGWYMPVFIIIGFVHSAHAFGDLSTPAKSYQFLLLPASNLEKFISVWLSVSLFYVAAGYVIFLLAAGLGGGLAAFTFDYHIQYDTFGYFGHLRTIGSFLVLQTIFLFGSLAFKNAAFIKTILSVVVFAIAFFVITLIITRMVIGGFVWDFQSLFEGDAQYALMEFFGNFVSTMIKILYWGVLGPFFLVVSYYKLKESEV